MQPACEALKAKNARNRNKKELQRECITFWFLPPRSLSLAAPALALSHSSLLPSCGFCVVCVRVCVCVWVFNSDGVFSRTPWMIYGLAKEIGHYIPAIAHIGSRSGCEAVAAAPADTDPPLFIALYATTKSKPSCVEFLRSPLCVVCWVSRSVVSCLRLFFFSLRLVCVSIKCKIGCEYRGNAESLMLHIQT